MQKSKKYQQAQKYRVRVQVLDRMIREEDEVEEEEEGNRNKIAFPEEEVEEVDKGRGEATTIGLS